MRVMLFDERSEFTIIHLPLDTFATLSVCAFFGLGLSLRLDILVGRPKASVSWVVFSDSELVSLRSRNPFTLSFMVDCAKSELLKFGSPLMIPNVTLVTLDGFLSILDSFEQTPLGYFGACGPGFWCIFPARRSSRMCTDT